MKKPLLSVLVLVALTFAAAALVGCGGRDTSTPAKALFGHWILMPAGSDWYFADDGTFTITAEDSLWRGTWKQISFDASTRTLVADLALDDAQGSLPYTLIFDPTYERAKFTAGTDEFMARNTLRYLDDETRPPR